MAILGGSPLGLIGIKSIPTNGMSGFNQSGSNNVIVNNYNRSEAGSLFTGRRRLRAWPNISESKSKLKDHSTPPNIISQDQDTTGLSDVYINSDTGKQTDKYKSSVKPDSKGSNLLHNNDVYDTSVLNILEKLGNTKAALKATDFAYLKYLGVYPNNRLMIARRFASPSGDNIMVKKNSKDLHNRASIATLISWVPENAESFVDIQFGEEWVAAKADFTGIMNSLGDDFSKTGMGKITGGAAGVLPLPGFTEIFQRKFLAKLGLLEDSAAGSIPAGNPNLIKEAKARKTVPYSSAEAGLMAKVEIKMTCEYELKFIAGIDPTIVWMDIIGMIGRFGTSESANYGLSQDVAAMLGSWANDPYKMLDDIVDGIKNALEAARGELEDGIKLAYAIATVAAHEMFETDEKKESAGNQAIGVANKIMGEGFALVNKLVGVAKDVIAASVMKYRVEMMGIVNALTGNPSTPWHITIGNPLRPVFCSGDMLVTTTTLKLGPELAFNDLPSSIIAEFTMSNARNLGLQEILAKFNSGYLRTVDVQKTFFETTVTTSKEKGTTKELPGYLPGEKEFINQAPPPPVVNQGGGDAATGSTASNPLGSTASNPLGSTASNPLGSTASNPEKSPTLVEEIPGSKGTTGSNTTSTDQSKLVGGQK